MVRNRLTPIRMAKPKAQETRSVGENAERSLENTTEYLDLESFCGTMRRTTVLCVCCRTAAATSEATTMQYWQRGPQNPRTPLLYGTSHLLLLDLETGEGREGGSRKKGLGFRTCATGISSISISWELVRNAESQALPPTRWGRTCIYQVPRQCLSTLRFKALSRTQCFFLILRWIWSHPNNHNKKSSQLNRISQANINYLKDVKITQTIQKCRASRPLGNDKSLAPILKSYHRIPFHREPRPGTPSATPGILRPCWLSEGCAWVVSRASAQKYT